MGETVLATREQTAHALDRAHDELLVRGHSQQFLEQADGSVCANGAIACVFGLRDEEGMLHWPHRSDRATNAVLAVVEVLWPDDPIAKVDAELALALWNDEEARTIDDVLDAFRTASKQLRDAS